MSEKKLHMSGEHKLALERSVSDPPLKHSSSGTPESTIDAGKLLKAWLIMTSVQKEQIRVVEKNEADNERTRASNNRTRWIVTGACAIMLVGTGVHTWQIRQQSHSTRDKIEIQHKQGLANHDLMKNVEQDVKETLQAVRATAEAIGASVEAEATKDPKDARDAAKKALEAQAEALDAEAKAEDDPAKKAEAGRKLEVVKAKARRPVRIEVDSGLLKAAPVRQLLPAQPAPPLVKHAAPKK